MKKTITTILAGILTSVALNLAIINSASAYGTTSYTKIGGNTWSNNFQTGQTCVYSKVGNITYRNCY